MQLAFNAAQFDPSMGIDPWPDGWVPVIIEVTEAKQTAAGDGGYLGCTLVAIDGPLKGKKQFLNINLWNKNLQAVEIANKTMSALIYVTLGANQGRITFTDTNELCNIPFLILSSRQKDDPSRNNFNAFRDVRGLDPKGQPPATPIVLAGTTGAGGHAPAAPAAPAFAPPAAAAAAPPAAFQPPAAAPAAAPAFAPPAAAAAPAPAPVWGQPAAPAAPSAFQPPAAAAAPAAAAPAPAPQWGQPAAPAPAWGQK